MNPRHVDFLRRLIADGAIERRLGDAAGFVAAHEGIGSVRGSKVSYTDADHVKARNLLLSRGHDLTVPIGNFTRSEAPRGGSEKSGARRVSENMVAVVPLLVPGLHSPQGSVLAMDADAALALPFDMLLVCENMEPMLQLHTYRWMDEFTVGRPTLALFRGAPGFFRTDVAAELIQRDRRPILAFFDFDPKGLSMAASMPRREALCLPPWTELQAAAHHNKRSHLFTNSLHTSRPHLDREGHSPDIAVAWERLKELSMGLDQEHFPR